MEPGNLSVVMPNYNHARYLPESLEALAGQSVRPREIIVVDDGSTDDSVAVIEAFARRHPFIVLLRQHRNQGVARALRRGFERCTGDYVQFASADDRVMPGCVEKNLRLLGRHPQAGLCTSLARLLGEDGRDIGPYETPLVCERECFLTPAEFVAAYLRHGSWLVTYSAVFRRSVVAESGVFEFSNETGLNFDCYMIFYAAAKYGACFIPEPLVYWRRIETSFGLRSADEGVPGALGHIERFEVRLRAPRCAGLFPEEFLRAWKRCSLAVLIYEYARRRPDDLRALHVLGGSLADASWLDRAYFAGLRRGWCGLTASKLYITLQKPWPERWRLLRRRLGCGGGG